MPPHTRRDCYSDEYMLRAATFYISLREGAKTPPLSSIDDGSSSLFEGFALRAYPNT